MDTKKLRQKILDLAIRGKLVPQDPNDEPASVLLERIRAEKERLIKEGKIKRSKKSTSNTPPYENEVPFEIPVMTQVLLEEACLLRRTDLSLFFIAAIILFAGRADGSMKCSVVTWAAIEDPLPPVP